MRIEPATLDDVRHVVEHMRDRDVQEFSAVSAAQTRQQLQAMLVDRFGARTDLIAARADNGTPIAVGGTIEHRPNVATLLFFATDRFPQVAIGLTRFIRRVLFPALRAHGVHRIECVSIAGYVHVHRWIEILGLRREAEFNGFGKNGETFLQFAWVRGC